LPQILIEKNFMVHMRDGVRLATDVYRLEWAITRIPCDKDRVPHRRTKQED